VKVGYWYSGTCRPPGGDFVSADDEHPLQEYLQEVITNG
jgi:hypothetical protein